MSMLHLRLRSAFDRYLPIGVIVNLAVLGMVCVFAAMRYLRLEFSLTAGMISIGLIGGIYLLNRYADGCEDFANDTQRLIFQRYKNKLYPLSVLLLMAAMLYLVVSERMALYPMILVFAGIAYSFPLLPWYTRRYRWHFVRLKQIPLMKNMLVALLWAFSIFLIPLLFANVNCLDWSLIGLLITAQIIATLSNTFFSDIRDRVGDSLAGNLTLPVLAGARVTYVVIVGLNLLWSGFSLWLWHTRTIDTPHLAFFLAIAAYPALYIAAYHSRRFSKGLIDILGDMQLLVYAAGLFFLS